MVPTRKDSEVQSLEQAELKYSAVFENTGTATIIIEADTTISAANKGFERLSGYSKDEIEGKKSWTEFFVEEELSLMKRYHERRRENPERAPNKYESLFVDRYGNEKNVLITVDMIPGTDKSVSSFADISDQKQAEKKLKEVEKVSRELKLATDEENLYELILDGIQETFGFDNCGILERIGESLILTDGSEGQFKAKGRELSLEGPGISVSAYRKNEPVYVPRVDEDDRFIPASPTSETKSEFAVPISMEGEVYGVLNLEDDQPDAFSVRDREMVTILASEMAVVLRGLERLESLERSRSKLRGLHRAVDMIQGCDSERELFDMAVTTLQEILEFDLCSIDRIDGEELIPQATTAEVDPGDTKRGEIGKGIGGKTAERGETIWGEDVQSRQDASPTRKEFHGFISVPVGDRAVMQVVSTEIGAFTEEDVELVEILAGHLQKELKTVELEKELKEQAIRDPLTGLYNRRFLGDVLQNEEERVKRYGGKVALLMIDLDDFKEINDEYSHLVGDEVLKEIANVLTESVRDADIVIRYGGDEFLIFMPEFENDMDGIVARIKARIDDWNEDSTLVDSELDLTVGTAVWDSFSGTKVENALQKADNRMYRNK